MSVKIYSGSTLPSRMSLRQTVPFLRCTKAPLVGQRFVTSMPASTTPQRLSLLSRHLNPSVDVQLTTPYSTERKLIGEEDLARRFSLQTDQISNRSRATMTSKQAQHPTVLIPGPVEFDDAVLESMSHFSYVALGRNDIIVNSANMHSQSHVGGPFVKCFSEVLKMTRDLVQTTNPNSQPFVISGSGTLGWDQVAANLAEPGDEALVLHTGYFGDSFADCLETYGVKATQIKAPIGDRPQLPEVERALKEKHYKLLTVTHVDTSTGVLSEIVDLIRLVRKTSPDTLVVVDGVCSVGCEEIRFDEWDVDVVLTASQKAIGCPAGLSILVASERAMNVFENRRVRPASYFASWKNWVPSKLFISFLPFYRI